MLYLIEGIYSHVYADNGDLDHQAGGLPVL